MKTALIFAGLCLLISQAALAESYHRSSPAYLTQKRRFDLSQLHELRTRFDESESPSVEIFSDSVGSPTYFQNIERNIGSMRSQFLKCYKTHIGNPSEYSRYKLFIFFPTISDTGALSLEQDAQLKETNASWSRIPEKHRLASACMGENLQRITFPEHDTGIDLEIRLNFEKY